MFERLAFAAALAAGALLIAACGNGADSASSGSSSSSSSSSSSRSSSSSSASGSSSSTPASGTDVVTFKNDVLRTGQNLTESTLTPSNVRSATFGLLRNLQVDGAVDAQPLYLSQLSVAGSAHNVVFVATENDSVYAFDADTGATLWQVSLLGAGEMASDDHGCEQITPSIGVTSTPVIDRTAGAHGTIFIVSMTKDPAGNYHQRLHALDVTTGAELSGSPVNITATFGATTFAPGTYAERAALLLVNGTLYTSWTSHCDDGPYGGWIIAFDEATLAQKGALNVAAGASGSGLASQGPAIWMSGDGAAADASGNVYVLTGNGRFDTTLNASSFPQNGDYGNSFVKLTSSGGTLAVSDYFTLSNGIDESTNDQDLGSGGVMLLPDLTDANGTVRHLVIGAGKDRNLYVVDRDAMGKFDPNANHIWQELDGVLGGGVWSSPAYFGGTVYYGPVGAPLLAFPVSHAQLASAPGSSTSTQFGYPGTSPVVSANGTMSAIVWAYENASGGAAVLHAYDATHLATELYNSNQAAGARDRFGSGNKFIVPTVADGKVFAASTNSVAVFGLLP
ncbi:MAG: pyrrolo-quinoline quinone [Steroidobacteraceae bacterium]